MDGNPASSDDTEDSLDGSKNGGESVGSPDGVGNTTNGYGQPIGGAALANGRHVFAPFLGAVEQIWSKKSIWLAWKREKDSSITPESLSF